MMTMNFDMNASNLGNAVNTSSALPGNTIQDVLFKGVEYSTSKDEKWEFMNIKFQGVKGGFFTDRVFGLKSDSGQRKQTQYGENPSEYEMLMMKVKHLINAVKPELLKDMPKFQAIRSKDSLFKQYVNFIGSILQDVIDTETKIKLVKNNKGETCFPPFFAAVSRDGVAYMKTNFIGDKLSFTDKEKELIEKQVSAKPTTMPSVDTDLSLGADMSMGAESVADVPEDDNDLMNMSI